MTATLPPGPTIPAPLQALRWLKRPLPFLLNAQREHGDVFTVTISPAEGPWVMLAHPDAVKEVFTGPPDKLLAGEGNAILEPIVGNRSVLLLDGPQHLRQRKLLLPAFQGSRMQRYGDLMREIAESEVASWPKERPFALAPRMQRLTLEIIIQAIFGVREGALLDRLRDRLQTVLDETTKPSSFLLVGILGPKVMKIPTFRKVIDAMDETILEVVAQRRRSDDLADRDDILSLLLQATDEEGNPMTDKELRDELVTLLVAGHETTATALSWAIERLVRHPERLDRLSAEVAAGESAYAEAVCTETLRLRPVLPLVLRRLAEPMTIAGHDLPAGVKVAPCIALVHRRPDLYPDPHAFVPERWDDQSPGTYTWLPFGGGVRRCLGAQFALFEMRTVLAAIVAGATLRPALAESEKIGRRAITLAPARGAEVVAA